MLEPLNIYTTNFKKYILLLFSFSILENEQELYAQQDRNKVEIQEIQETESRQFKFDIYLYSLYNSMKSSYLYTATNQLFDKSMYNSIVDIGISTSLYTNNYYQFNIAVGYMYSRYAINRGIKSDGITTNWVNFDFSAMWQEGLGLFYQAGIKVDYYLSEKTRATDDFYYSGLNYDCFNQYSYILYFGLVYYLSIFKIEMKFGGYIKPLLNPNKVTYYNAKETTVNRQYIEIGLGLRIFSNNRKYNSLIDTGE